MADKERTPPFLRTAYNYDVDLASLESGLFCADESLASQEYRDEVDINTIVRRHGLGYEMPQNFNMPTHADFTETVGFQEGLNLLIEAKHQFATLPAGVRAKFGNDPEAIITFLEDVNNREEAQKLGLIPTPKPEPIPPVEGTVTT